MSTVISTDGTQRFLWDGFYSAGSANPRLILRRHSTKITHLLLLNLFSLIRKLNIFQKLQCHLTQQLFTVLLISLKYNYHHHHHHQYKNKPLFFEHLPDYVNHLSVKTKNVGPHFTFLFTSRVLSGKTTLIFTRYSYPFTTKTDRHWPGR